MRHERVRGSGKKSKENDGIRNHMHDQNITPLLAKLNSHGMDLMPEAIYYFPSFSVFLVFSFYQVRNFSECF